MYHHFVGTCCLHPQGRRLIGGSGRERRMVSGAVSKPVRGIGFSVMGQKKKCNRKECVEML